MKHRNKKTVFFGLFLSLVTSSCTSPQKELAMLLKDKNSGLVQVKQGRTRSIRMEVLPDFRKNVDSVGQQTQNDFYRIRITLSTDQKIKGYDEMQYLNFGIGEAVYAVQGKDTLPCTLFERVPGISDKEFQYISAFDKSIVAEDNIWNLRIYLNDEISGWGEHEFEINNSALKKINAIKF